MRGRSLWVFAAWAFVALAGRAEGAAGATEQAAPSVEIEGVGDLESDTTFAEDLTVFAVSRRQERIVEAPAAVSLIPAAQIEREAGHGQLPKLLENAPGTEASQSGLFDFNFNARGFNSSVSRRVLVLIDGRDPSVPFLGAQEWASLSFALGDVDSIELVRGPGSALYGADAFNGVVHIVTRSPASRTGGRLRLTGGELDTQRLEARYSARWAGGWFGRVAIGAFEGDDFTRSRNLPAGALEYPGLPSEVIPLALHDNQVVDGHLRVDHDPGEGAGILSLEAGSSRARGPVITAGIGRIQMLESERPYLRVAYGTARWNASAYLNQRQAEQLSLASGATLFSDSEKLHLELQGNLPFASERGRLVGGVSYGREDVDTADAGGIQTLVFEPVKADLTGAYGQVEYDFSERIRGVAAARWDDSSLHSAVFSPRLALVVSAAPGHSLRFNYGEAFQTPNYAELFLRVPVAPPITDLAALEATFCSPFGVDCGLASVPVLAVGNPEVDVEQVSSLEIGYSGVLGSRVFLTVDLYKNRLTELISDLITAVQPELGRINPAFGPYRAPRELPPEVAAGLEATLGQLLGPTFALWSNGPVDGRALMAALSYTNFGRVEARGAELALAVRLSPQLQLSASYAHFAFEVAEQLASDPLIPNTPQDAYSLGLTYTDRRFDATFNYRRRSGFDWSAGLFAGAVPAYGHANLAASYRISERLAVGVNVTNLFDSQDFQVFGGDRLGRRALLHFDLSW